MEQKRLLIAIALSFVVFLIWQLFFVDKEALQRQARKQVQPAVKKEQPVKQTPYVKGGETQTVQPVPLEKQVTVSRPAKAARTITVDTPLYRASISEQGAGFSHFLLKKYRQTVAPNSPFLDLLAAKVPFETVLVQFAGQTLPGLQKAVFSAGDTPDTVPVKDQPRKISFVWSSGNGVVVEKTFKFSPDSYVINLEVSLKNGTHQPIRDQLVVSLTDAVPSKGSRYGFEGPSALINGKLKQIKIKKIAKQGTYAGKVQWIALQGRYFMSSIIPQQPTEAQMQLALKPPGLIEARYVQPESVIQPATQQTFDYHLFLGPMSMKILGQVGDRLDKAVNFGWFDILAKPMVWLMNFIYGFIPNYGVAIIILTILTKIVLWPLGTKSYKSMNEMKRLQPLMKEIREKYKNDKKRMNQEVMGLYKTYKINPMGGCLPMIVQIPVFFALYRMLYQAIELRHAPFFLWINDLSAPDRLFSFDFHVPFMQPPYGIPVLTIVMGATMLLQQKMSPPMGDPSQAKMMMFMPIIFTVIFINFPAGLVLYWLVNNILSIAQQYYIQKKYA